MSIDDLVKITTYLHSSDYVVTAGAARAQSIQGMPVQPPRHSSPGGL